MSGQASLDELIGANVAGELDDFAHRLSLDARDPNGPNRATVMLVAKQLERVANGIREAMT